MTELSASPFDNLVAWFIASFVLPSGVQSGYRLDPDSGRPVAHFLTAADGSWCDVELDARDGRRTVRQDGPRQLWDSIETSVDTWEYLGRPGWDRFGVTVTVDESWVWLDTPHRRIGNLGNL
ncbi:hypothetical protein [Crossiella sp. CA198]|uniref:hypothetical protein n=1 Tax=Crossiella sp. CA198 TaxID=3455607 RepID=UPI003F8D7435